MVVIVSVVVALTLELLSEIEDGLKLHVASDGSPEQEDALSVALPLNPPLAAMVSVVVPDCPGPEILIAFGFGVTVNAGVTVTDVLAPMKLWA